MQNARNNYNDTVPFTVMSKYVLDKYKKQYGNVYEKGAKDFYDIVTRIQKIYKGKILVTYLGSFQTTNTCIKAFKKYAEKNATKNIEFIDFSKKLNHKFYFFYDDHLNKYGHEIVGIEIATWYENMAKSGKLN